MTQHRVLICDACEEFLLDDPALYDVYQRILRAWACELPYTAHVFADGSVSSKYSTLDRMQLISSTDFNHDKILILPKNCPHIKG